MPESAHVRVTDKDTGHRLTIPRSELPNGNYSELKAEPYDELGDPLAPEFNVTKSTSAGQSAASDKE